MRDALRIPIVLSGVVAGLATGSGWSSTSTTMPASSPPASVPVTQERAPSFQRAPKSRRGAPPAYDSEYIATVDFDLPTYVPVAGLSGDLISGGSDTMGNLMTDWGHGFFAMHPGVCFRQEGHGGSWSACLRLVEGTVQLCPMLRELSSEEVTEFRRNFGYAPTQVRVAIDALAIYVNKDNPIESVLLGEVDAIYGKLRKRRFPTDLATWGELGLAGEWEKRPIRLYGRNPASGTYGFLKRHVLQGGDFKDSVLEEPGSASVILHVTDDAAGIGYAGVAYRSNGVRVVPLAIDEDSDPVLPVASSVYSGKYPLVRFLYIYVNKPPDRPLAPLTRQFLEFVLSQSGQRIVVKDGYFPLTAGSAAEERSTFE